MRQRIEPLKFNNKEDGLSYLSRVAQLKRGDIITWIAPTGTERGVFVGLNEDCRVVALCLYKDGDAGHVSLHPATIIFEARHE